MSFFVLLSIQTTTAQTVEVISETESFSQATYHIRFDGHEAKVTIRKEQGKVSILLKNRAGETLGKGFVENDCVPRAMDTIENLRQQAY